MILAFFFLLGVSKHPLPPPHGAWILGTAKGTATGIGALLSSSSLPRVRGVSPSIVSSTIWLLSTTGWIISVIISGKSSCFERSIFSVPLPALKPISASASSTERSRSFRHSRR